ncbi:MAG: error-prone DNA polymerase [Pirellulaceae bacterium]
MRYAELHCKTNFSFLVGASHAEELVLRAKELGYHGLAVTDVNSLAGVVRAHLTAKEHGLKLLVGAELTPVDAPAVVVWATDRKAYGRLSRLLTVGRRRAEKGQCSLALEDIAAHAEGLIAGVLPHSPAPSPQPLFPYRDIFADRAYLLAELFRGPDDAQRLSELVALSKKTKLPLVAAGDVHYHSPARQPLHEVLTAVRLGKTVAEIGGERFPNAQRHLRSIEEIVTAFSAAPGALKRTLEIADRCQFSLDELKYEYPEELAPQGLSPTEYLNQLTWEGAANRYPAGIPEKVLGLLQYELQLIEELKYEAYFLTVWDLVRFARSRGILCQGRGSAANSAVCYCLGVTSVDPDRADLLFERFISKERNEAPDIDVDFEHERREEVLQYLYDKYGRERAGMTGVVITYRSRSAVRDVGKALGFSLDRVDALAKQVDGHAVDDLLPQRCREVGIDPESPLGSRLVYLVNELLGFPRHLSQHVGGMVMTQGPLCELAPIENAAMPGRTVIEWDKNDLDELGILKVDCLALGMLTAIRKCFDLIRQHHGRELTLATIPAEDPVVYDMICEADTIGVFQIESRAQISMLPRLRPRCYYDLVIEVAIVRPGPIQGDMVHPYLRRRCGEEVPEYPSEVIRQVLHKTLGVPLFQEQAMRLAVVAAGFTPGEADQLRRAMGAWRKTGVIEKFRVKLMKGMKANGLPDKFAEQVFHQIKGFGEYGFPESHAASFALLVYVSAWLKRYYPAAFCASLINSQPMGFYAPAQLIRDARDHDVRVLPADVNESGWDCGVQSAECKAQSEDSLLPSSPAPSPQPLAPSLRLGLRLISGLPEAAARAIEEARKIGRFTSLDDFVRRTKLCQPIVAKLAQADCFGSLAMDRRKALWHALGQEKKKQSQPLLANLEEEEPAAELPPMSLSEQVFADYRTSGLSLKAHPISFFRQELQELKVTPAKRLLEMPDGRFLRVAGIILLRQRPSTAKGITFVTMEDETGIVNLVVKQQIWEQFYSVARKSPAWIVHGRLERREKVIHILVSRIEDLSVKIGDLRTKSRDFR